VVTHSVSIALSLSTRPHLTIMLIGGRLRSRTLATVDSWALHALHETFVDVAFIATNGITAERGLTTPDSAEAMIKRAAIASARRCVLLADHTKVGNDYFTRFAELKDIDTVITDNGADQATMDEIAACGPRIVLA
jgi:DeoR family transcriptional regulator, fructose operon transcriptional repressor